MWNVSGITAEEKQRDIEILRSRFHGLRGRIPGLLHLEVGVDASRVDYACDVVLCSEFESWAALDAYARHPDHLRVRDELAGSVRNQREAEDAETTSFLASYDSLFRRNERADDDRCCRSGRGVTRITGEGKRPRSTLAKGEPLE